MRRAAPRRWRPGGHARRLNGLTRDAAALLALARHLRPRLAPSGDIPTPAVAERIVQMSAAELRKLGQQLRARRAAEAGEE